MFCPKCGKNMPDTAKFCGKKVETESRLVHLWDVISCQA